MHTYKCSLANQGIHIPNHVDMYLYDLAVSTPAANQPNRPSDPLPADKMTLLLTQDC